MARAAAEADYDRLPYPSLPFAYTQPGHLAALAMLYGLQPPGAETARVLELGCASGGNVIPLAARFPQARFHGIDLAERHIRDGLGRIAALGLTNIELRQGDLAQIDLAGERVDFVICHGVFSWAPRAAQDGIFRICRNTLAPNGLAVVSYNVLPGWHLRGIVRDICLHHAGGGPPRERVARAREALAEIAGAASETEPYGRMLRSEAARCAQLPSAYILGEFLAAENTPLHFRDFAGRANEHGLSFLCEADLGASMGENATAAMANRLDNEQRQDFITGRTFRRSVLIRTDDADKATFPPSADKLAPLPSKTGRADAERPVVWPLARIEAAAKQPWLTSLTHEAVPLHILPVDLIAHLDGSKDRSALAAQFGEDYLECGLELLAKHALLAPE